MTKFNGENMLRMIINRNLKTKIIIYFLLIFILFTLNSLLAQNQMELIAELTGEHPRSEFGFCAANLDFNGDGIDDLAVGAYRWDPEYPGWPAQAAPWGKIYMYFGKEEEFGDSIDFTISGFDSLMGFGKHLENLGDMNGDGFEDLGYRTDYFDSELNVGHYYVNILLGNNVLDSIPDYSYEFLTSDGYAITHTPSIKWLGDINGDGYDDAGFVISKIEDTNEEEDWVYLIFGNEFELQYFAQIGRINTIINGIGNVNADGFDDFIIGYYIDRTVEKLLYYGETENDSIPDIILTDIVSNPYFDTTGGVAVGDWNGDGIDDFNVGIDSEGPDIWFGTETNLSQNMHLNFYDWLVNRNNDYGDLNGDEKDDFVGGNDGGMAGLDGDAYIFLGCQNGTYDYHIEGEYGVGLGWSVAIGDFNNDGYDDVTTGGIGRNSSGLNDCWCGKVYVYSGNADLVEADPNIAIEEDIVPKPIVEFNAYPNPFNPNITFEIKAEGYDNLQIEIYNVKGQKVKTLVNDGLEKGIHEVLWTGKNDNNKSVASGVYFYKFDVNDKTRSVKKCLMLK